MRPILVVSYVIVVLLLGIMFCRISDNPGAGADPADLLPRSGDVSGFEKRGATVVMTDRNSIYEAVDGQAEKYIDYGFVEGVQQLYGNGITDIDVQVFHQGDERNAAALFEDFFPSAAEYLSQRDPVVVVDHSFPTIYSLLYQRENIFLRINTLEKTDFALTMVKQFYLNIDAKVSVSGQ